jgi:carbonic anhydrase/acetyltransferase-like protein (isoleucine patch superfamily)
VDFLLLIAVLHSRTVGELVFIGVTVGVGATVVTGATVGVGATVVTGETVGVGIGAGETVAVLVNDDASLPAVSCIAELEVAEFGVGAV